MSQQTNKRGKTLKKDAIDEGHQIQTITHTPQQKKRHQNSSTSLPQRHKEIGHEVT
jgi:hypothetical protein